MQTQHNI